MNPWVHCCHICHRCVWVQYCKGDNCCGSTDCPDSCPWAGSCSNGNDFSCMDRVSGGLKCRDSSACSSYDSCNKEEAAYRSGQLCRGFPWFNGGYPFDNIKFDDEYKAFQCDQASINGEYCWNWSHTGNSLDELEIGNTTCLVTTNEPNSTMKYCPYWRTVKKEYKKCFYDWVSSQENGMVWSEICCNKDNRYVYTCCDQSCSAEYYNARFPQVEKEDCFCLEAAANGNYCRRWNCTNIDVYNEYLLTEVPNSHPDQKYYECTAESPDGQYCANWEGQSESVEEFEVSKCFCKTHGTYCFTWDCLEKGVDFWWPNLLWILLSSLLGGLGQVPALLLVGSMAKTGFLLAIYIYYACMLIWGGGFIVIGVWKCGILALIVTGTQIFILPLYFFYVLWRRVHRDDNNNSTQKRRHRSGRGYLSMSRNCLAGCLESLARGLRQEPSVQYFPEPQTVPPAAVAVPGEAVNEVELGGMVFDADDPALAVKAGDGYAPVAMAL